MEINPLVRDRLSWATLSSIDLRSLSKVRSQAEKMVAKSHETISEPPDFADGVPGRSLAWREATNVARKGLVKSQEDTFDRR